MSNEYGRFSEDQIAAWLKERVGSSGSSSGVSLVSVKVMDDEKRRVACSDLG